MEGNIRRCWLTRSVALYVAAWAFITSGGCDAPGGSRGDASVADDSGFPAGDAEPHPDTDVPDFDAGLPRYPQRFRVEGNRILDEAGNRVVLRGGNIGGPVPHRYFTEHPSDAPVLHPDEGPVAFPAWDATYYRRIGEFGAKIVRLNIRPCVFREYQDDYIFEAVDQTLAWLAENEMYAFITLHGAGFPPTEYFGEPPLEVAEEQQASQEEIFRFWDEISSRYRDNATVAFYELFNEPTWSSSAMAESADPTEAQWASDWIMWRDFAERLIDVIRANDPDGIALVGGLRFGYDLFHAIEHPVRRDNVIYGTHPYPCKYELRSWDDAFGAVQEVYPVFASEFTVGGLEDGPLKCEEVQTMLRGMVDLEDLIAEAALYAGNRARLRELYLEALVRIQAVPTAYAYLLGVREAYRNEIESYLEDRDIGWTGYIHFSIQPEHTMIDANYIPNEQGVWFSRWLHAHRSNEPR